MCTVQYACVRRVSALLVSRLLLMDQAQIYHVRTHIVDEPNHSQAVHPLHAPTHPMHSHAVACAHTTIPVRPPFHGSVRTHRARTDAHKQAVYEYIPHLPNNPASARV